jgi:YD repeat-containing protein
MGNLLEFSKNNGVKTCLIWGYNNSKLIAKIENLNYTNISQAMIDNLNLLSNADNDDCFNGNCNEQILRNALNNLRNLYPESFVTTYTYNPLIGVTSITDVKGKREFYQYDKQLRLKIIRDNEGNILKGYGYNYKNN